MCSVVDKLNTHHNVVYFTTHSASLQGDGVAGLKTLVESPAPGEAQPATAATAVVGVVPCLTHLARVLVDIDPGPLTRIIPGLITKGDHVDPGPGGREHS